MALTLAPACLASGDVTEDTDAELATPSLRIAFTGGGVGEVSVFDEDTFNTVATCRASCTVPATAGGHLTITGATPQIFGGLSGACTSATNNCTVTIGAGRSTVTATFTPAPGEVFTRLFDDGSIRTAAFDGAGRLIVASGTLLTKLGPGGGTVWQLPFAACNIATGPQNTIYAQTTTSITKLSAAGATLWTQPLDANSQGCGHEDFHFEGFVHDVAVGKDGAVVVHGLAGLTKWDKNGVLAWSVAAPAQGNQAVGIDPHGVISIIAEDPISPEARVLRQFAPDGTEITVPDTRVAPQSDAMFVIDPVGRFLITSSGHNHTDALGRSVRIGGFGAAPSGIAAAASDAIWLYEDSDLDFFARTWTMNRYHADNTQASSYVAHPGSSPGNQNDLGTVPGDLVGALDGRVAVVGAFNARDSFFRSWVTVFAP
jgi:hypothetical protein